MKDLFYLLNKHLNVIGINATVWSNGRESSVSLRERSHLSVKVHAGCNVQVE